MKNLTEEEENTDKNILWLAFEFRRINRKLPQNITRSIFDDNVYDMITERELEELRIIGNVLLGGYLDGT